jgi:hypothetical protein
MSKLDDIFSDEFTAAVKTAIAQGVAETLKAGVPIFYRETKTGFDVMEHPDGRRFQIRGTAIMKFSANSHRRLPKLPRKPPNKPSARSHRLRRPERRR